MKNIMRETVGSARWKKVACRELFSVLRYRGQNAKGFKRSSDQKCLSQNQKAPISLAPPSRAGELQRAAGTRPLRMCGSTGAPPAWRGVPGGHVSPLRNPL